MLNVSELPSGTNHGEPYWAIELPALFAKLGARREGLSEAEALERLKRVGPNAVKEHGRTSALRLLLRQFESPLVLILVFGALVALVVHELLDAAIVLLIVLGSAALGFLQEFNASIAVSKLRARLALSVPAIRDGVRKPVPVADLVPGDIVELSAGNLVPADGRIIAARDFLVSEAALTGETFPVEKVPGIAAADAPLAARTNCVFLGTSVRSGVATVLIVGTGRATALGEIAARLEAAAPETEFARGVRQFGYLLTRVMVVIVVAVLAVNVMLGRPLDGVAAVRRGARGRSLARAVAGDRQRDALGRCPRHGRARRLGAAARGHRESRQHGRALHRQDRHAHRRQDRARSGGRA